MTERNITTDPREFTFNTGDSPQENVARLVVRREGEGRGGEGRFLSLLTHLAVSPVELSHSVHLPQHLPCVCTGNLVSGTCTCKCIIVTVLHILPHSQSPFPSRSGDWEWGYSIAYERYMYMYMLWNSPLICQAYFILDLNVNRPMLLLVLDLASNPAIPPFFGKSWVRGYTRFR